MGLGSALLRARTRAAVSGIAGLCRKDIERVLLRTLARTSATSATLAALDLRRFSWKFTNAADACGTLRRRKKSETVLSRELCTERKKGELLGFLVLSLCSYMVYILGLTVLGTVSRGN